MLGSFLIEHGTVRYRGGVSTIDAKYSPHTPSLRTQIRPSSTGARLTVSIALALVACCFLALATTAYAGQASTGKLFFYPCTTCHPVVMGADGQPTKRLPNGFKGHDIVLVGHDVLGEGTEACLACHDDPARNPGKLKLIDGSLVDIQGDIAGVCQKCHSAKYKEWKAGTHGKNLPKCTAAGCHDPHSPQWIYAAPQLPFVGTGFQARMVSQRRPFTPLASPPVPPLVVTPVWLVVGLGVFGIIAAGLLGWLIVGRVRR